VVLIAVLAFLLALDPERMVLDLVAYAWAGFGAAFGPALILSLHWKRMTAKGALAGILSGGLTVAVWKELQGGVFDLYEIVPGFGISFVFILIVSLLDKAPDPEISREFDNVNLRVKKP
jgi:sodium/proline symporter